MSILENWIEEKRSAWLYRIVSDAESGTPRQVLFLELAQVAENQAAIWADLMAKAGEAKPVQRAPGHAGRRRGDQLPPGACAADPH